MTVILNKHLLSEGTVLDKCVPLVVAMLLFLDHFLTSLPCIVNKLGRLAPKDGCFSPYAPKLHCNSLCLVSTSLATGSVAPKARLVVDKHCHDCADVCGRTYALVTTLIRTHSANNVGGDVVLVLAVC